MNSVLQGPTIRKRRLRMFRRKDQKIDPMIYGNIEWKLRSSYFHVRYLIMFLFFVYLKRISIPIIDQLSLHYLRIWDENERYSKNVDLQLRLLLMLWTDLTLATLVIRDICVIDMLMIVEFMNCAWYSNRAFDSISSVALLRKDLCLRFSKSFRLYIN